MQHDGAVDFGEKAFRGRGIGGHNAVGVCRAVALDVLDGGAHARHHPHGNDGVQIFRGPVLFGGEAHSGIHAASKSFTRGAR